MKTFPYIVIFLILPMVSFSQKVKFTEGTWQQINDRAAEENRFIFVDAYTQWCGWCKVMDKEMFTDPEVASVINDHFIAVKIDFEDSLGVLLSKKFRVWAYPTTLVFNSNGQLTGKFSGYSEDHGKYLDFLQKNMEIREERVFGYDSRELNLPYPDFYNKSFGKGEARKWTPDSTVQAWLQLQPDLYSEVCWSVLSRFHPRAYDDHVINNIASYKAIYGKEETTEFVYSVIYRKIIQAADSNNPAAMEQAVKLCDLLDDPAENGLHFRMTYYQRVKDWKGFAGAFESYLALPGKVDYMTINNNCWTIYENVDDQDILRKAAGWMKPVIDEEPEWMYLDTYAALLYKCGNLEEALKYADLAIKAGEKEKQPDISGTVELRAMILAGLQATNDGKAGQ